MSLRAGGGLNEIMCTRDNRALCFVLLHKFGSLETILPRNDIKEILVQLEEESPPHQANGETGDSNAPSVKLKSQEGEKY